MLYLMRELFNILFDFSVVVVLVYLLTRGND